MTQEPKSNKKRARSSKKQIQILVDFVRDNNEMSEDNWDEITLTLNSSGQGPQKCKGEWKKVFLCSFIILLYRFIINLYGQVLKELKTNVKRHARQLAMEQNKTGGGISSVKPLTEQEEIILGLIAKVTVEGSNEVQELGVEQEEVM